MKPSKKMEKSLKKRIEMFNASGSAKLSGHRKPGSKKKKGK